MALSTQVDKIESMIPSNKDVSQMQLYAGIAGVGAVAGATLAVSGSPLYHDNMPMVERPRFDQKFTPAVLSIGNNPIDKDMYELAQKNGQNSTALRYEAKAYRDFNTMAPEKAVMIHKAHQPPPAKSPGLMRRLASAVSKRL